MRKRYLAKKVQVKYAVMLCGVLLILLALTQIYTLRSLNQILPHILSDRIGYEINRLQTHLLIFGVIYTAVVALLSIYVTHRMAGPVYRMEADARRLAKDPNLSFRFKVRRKDEFHEVVDSLNMMMEKLQQKYEGKERS